MLNKPVGTSSKIAIILPSIFLFLVISLSSLFMSRQVFALLGITTLLTGVALNSLSSRQLALVPLHAAILLLTVYPVFRVVLPGSIPIYFVDVFLGLLLIKWLLQRDRKNAQQNSGEQKTLALLVGILWLPSTFFNTISEMSLLNIISFESLYVSFRFMLSISIFFTLPALLRTKTEFEKLFWSISFGIFLTAIINIINSIFPPSHPLNVFFDSLTPGGLSLRLSMQFNAGFPVGGAGLIGSTNASGMLLGSLFPILFGLYISRKKSESRVLLLVFMIFTLIGILVTYSRAAYLSIGIFILFLVFRWFPNNPKLIPVAFLLCGLLYYVYSSNYVNLNYMGENFGELQNLQDYNVKARTSAYSGAWKYLQTHPQSLFIGRGLGTYDLLQRRVISAEFYSTSEILNTQNHSFLVVFFYQRGFLSFMLLPIIYFYCYVIVNKRKNLLDTQHMWIARSLQAALLCMLPGWFFDHYYGTSVHMHTSVFLLFGLVAAFQSRYKNKSDIRDEN